VSPRRERALDAVVLVAAKLAIGAWVAHQGFTHVSDDDYARTVIAERFAHAPALDPSGTSWLPLPFWVTGVAMMAAGRTIAVARGAAVVLGAAAAAAPYAAMRAAGVGRWAALGATAVAMALPWNAWLGVAAVPEGWFGAIVAAAVIAMPVDAARGWAAAGLLAASLARYEAWPACAVLAALCAWRAWRSRVDAAPWREATWAAVALAGPIAWMAWNAHAHGSALHFLARVATFRQAIGAAAVPLGEKLLAFPLALVEGAPEAAVLGAVGLAGLASSRALRVRWGWPAAAATAILAFLVLGDVRDGAPTHHPERALVALWWVLAGMGADAAATLWSARGRPSGPRPTAHMRIAAALAALAAGAWAVTLPARWADFPGSGDADRQGAIARGLDMRARGVAAASITPCAFEHFALLAAWGEPERATLEPRTGEPVTAACPHVVER